MINITNLSLYYGERALFSDVSFTIQPSDRIGLVGRNGAGKSTLMKIIAGHITTFKGSVDRPSGSTLGFLHQDINTPKGKTVMEEALSAFEEVRTLEKKIDAINGELEVRTDYESEGYEKLLHDLSDATDRMTHLGGYTIHADTQRILTGLGFKPTDMDRLTDEFSGGWQMRIELAKMLLQKPDFLLLDEPTNHLDIESIIWLEEFLVTYEGAVMVISHDKMFLDNVTKRTIEIELGNVYDYKANYTEYKVMRAERRGLQKNAFDNQQRQIAQTQRLIDRFKAKASKAKMAQSLVKQLDRMDVIELDDEDNAAMRIQFLPSPRSGERTVHIETLTKSYGHVHVLDKVNLHIDRGDRIAFVGQNGQGKSTLSKIIGGIERASSGVMNLGHNVMLGYYAQNQAEELPANRTLLEVMESEAPDEMRPRIRAILGAFMFSNDDVFKKVSVLSGGERARLALAVLMLKPINLLILDEPTNHLDLVSKDVLKRAITEFDGTLIVVSHDRDFLQDLTSRTIEFRDRQLYEYLGDVYYFLNKRKVDNFRAVDLGTQTTPILDKKNEIGTKNAAEQKSSQADEKQIKKLEKAVSEAEKRIHTLEEECKKMEAEMYKPDFYHRSDADAFTQLYQDKKKALEVAYSNWEQATVELELKR